MTKISLEDILRAGHDLKGVAKNQPLEINEVLSERYHCQVFLKREDLQLVRSFKIRGAYNKMSQLSKKDRDKGVVCASAGNHGQGVAFSCKTMGCKGKIFMPVTTPKQKIAQVHRFGGDCVEIVLVGDTFDESNAKALEFCEKEGMFFIHPFNDPSVIAGQGTIGLEIMNDDAGHMDYIFAAIGGGGLASGVGSYVKGIRPATKVIGVEPTGAADMALSIEKGEVTALDSVDKFADGAAVMRVGDLTYEICKEVLDDIVIVPEGKICTTILELYNNSAIVTEPAGALTIAALEFYKDKIKGKKVACIISGGNNDIARMQEIKERSLLYEGIQHYFIINFPQRPGALREFLTDVLGPDDDIIRFNYSKSNDKEKGPTLLGIELSRPEDYQPLIERMEAKGFRYTVVNQSEQLFNLFCF
ncbi:MAG: threonine ammonia-lyase IlvA [Clostridiales bacterium]